MCDFVSAVREHAMGVVMGAQGYGVWDVVCEMWTDEDILATVRGCKDVSAAIARVAHVATSQHEQIMCEQAQLVADGIVSY